MMYILCIFLLTFLLPVLIRAADPCLVDLMIVIDASGSVSDDDDFQKEKEFVLDVIKFPSPAWYREERLNIGIVKFTSTAEVVLPFSGSNQTNAVAAVEALESEGGSTSAMSGMRLALSQIRLHRRPYATVVLLFVSDGNSGQQDTFKGMKELGEQLKNEGIIGFSMTFSRDAYVPELVTYAGSEDRVYRGDQSTAQLTKFESDLQTITRNIQACGPATGEKKDPDSWIRWNACKLDVVVVMDVSGSITEDADFEAERRFIRQTLQTPEEEWFEDDNLKLGFVTFTDTAETAVPFGTHARSDVLYTLDSLRPIGGNTSAISGMRIALDMLNKNRREIATQMILLVSDGNSGKKDPFLQTLALGDELRREKILTFSVTFSNNAYTPELRAYAGSMARVHRGDQSPAAIDSFNMDMSRVYGTPGECAAVKRAIEFGAAMGTGYSQGHPCKARIMIVMDTSGSIKEAFGQERDFVRDVFNLVDERAFRFGLVTIGLTRFSSRAFLNVAFSNEQNKTRALNALHAIGPNGGTTSALSGMQVALDEVVRYRQTFTAEVVPRMAVILVSDGRSGLTDTYDEMAKMRGRLEEQGAVIYAVTFSPSYLEKELLLYTGSKDRIYTRDRVPQFEKDMLAVAVPSACQLKN